MLSYRATMAAAGYVCRTYAARQPEALSVPRCKAVCLLPNCPQAIIQLQPRLQSQHRPYKQW